MDEHVDQITQCVVAVLCLAILGAISVVAAVALFGPIIAPLMNYLPW
ncbi:MAG: hypothetical protein HY693_02225 [Deltaproteobacteria bacterium]|nr:hypothetical protein [Deltaproteobacteria bacterium]